MWKFKKLERGDPERDPHESEFFRLTNVTEAIVREFIQNSLDAKQPGSPRVKVRFTLGSVRRSSLERILTEGEDLKKHLQACKLLPEQYNEINPVLYVTIEDFGTTGLDGDTWEAGERPAGRQNFYNFWWCEGKSLKQGREAGRWGLGKTTFHLASRLRAFWGLTVRSDDDRMLLMGKALLKTHKIDDITYQYYGYYVDDEFKPVTSSDKIAEFVRMFGLTRNNEPGFSLVIPMPEGEIDKVSILHSAIFHYFYAIISGLLEVEIQDSEGVMKLESSNLTEIAMLEDWQGTEWDKINVGVFLRFIKNCIDMTDRFELPRDCAERLVIDEASFGEEINRLRESFLDGQLVAIRVPVRVQKSRGVPQDTYYDIYLQRDGTLRKAQEYYIRSGITVVDLHSLRNRPVRALFVAQDKHITAFLGDAETPAHTVWNEKTEGFKEKYVDAASLLRFIKSSVETIVSLLDLPPKERQIDFLKDIFYITRPVQRDEEETTPPIVPPDIVRRKPIFNITQSERGLRVSLADKGKRLPLTGKLELAYDVRRGNPFNQYKTHDFDVSSGGIQVTNSGCRIITATQNLVKFEVLDVDFILELTGFDRRRDLVVKVNEVTNETQT